MKIPGDSSNNFSMHRKQGGNMVAKFHSGSFMVFFNLILITRVDSISKESRFVHCQNRSGGTTNVLGEETAESVLHCGSICLRDAQCKSASFNTTQKRCILSSTGYRFHESKCECLEEEKNAHFIYVNYPCYYQMPLVSGSCQCAQGYTGNYCETPPQDCSDYTPEQCTVGSTERTIYPYGGDNCGITVFCSKCVRLTLFRAPNGGFLKNKNASWETFKSGFGRDYDPDYWLGNEYMHQITANPYYKYTLCLYLMFSIDESDKSNDIYRNVYVANETSRYTVYFSNIMENNLPAAKLTNGSSFQTYDEDDYGCISQHGVAFWYPTDCSLRSPLGGTYFINAGYKQLTKIHAYIQRI